MAKKTVRIGIIGVGGAAQVNHIPAYRKLKDVEIVALCETDAARARAVSQRFGIPHVFSDFEDLLRADALDLDAVDICTPTHLHGAMALAALGYGKHVLIERPFAHKTSEAEAVVQAASKNACTVMVAFNHRFRPDAQVLRQFVQKGELGNIYYGKAGWLRGRESWQGGASTDGVSGRGVLMDLGVQMLDLALWLTAGSVVTVSSSTHRREKARAAEDAAVAFLRLDTGATITLDVSWSLLQDKDFAFLNLFGTKGAALFNPLRMHKVMHGNLVNVTPTLESERSLYKRSYELEIEHFVDCVRRGVEPLTSAEQALGLMRVLDAIYRSAEQGKELRLA
jgi:predicted dehydrogenase